MATLGEQLAAQTDAPSTLTPIAGPSLGEQVVEQLQTAAVAGGAFRGVNAPIELRRPHEGIEQYARPGIDLDVSQGVPWTTRIGLSFTGDDDDRIVALRRAYNNATVEKAGDNLIVRNVLDPSTGKVKDLLVDEEQPFTRGDFADMAKPVMQGIVELFATKGIGRAVPKIAEAFGAGTKAEPFEMGRFGRLAAESAGGAFASEVAGGMADMSARLLRDQPIRLEETAKAAGKGTLTGTGLGMGMAGVLEGGAGLMDALTGRATGILRPGAGEAAGIESIRKLNLSASPEEEILPTVGQMAKNPDVVRFESVMAKLPIVGRIFRAPLESQEQAIRSRQRKLLQGEPLRPMSELGAEAVETLRTVADEPAATAKAAETSLIERATDELETVVQRMHPSARPFTAQGAAAMSKLGVRNQYGAFQQRADELFEEAGNPIIKTDRMQKELSRIRDDLPKKTVINESEIVDAVGKPLATTEGKAIINELVPSKLNSLMRGLDQLDAEMPLSEMRRIRKTIDSAIVDGRGLNEVSTYELTQLRDAITRTIDDGVSQLGDSTVGKKLSAANTFYREGIDRFEDPFISRFLKRNPVQPGFMKANELLTAIQNDPDAYQALERFMRSTVTEGGQAIGPSTTREFNILRRTLTEEIFSRARVQPGATAASIDADAVLRELNQLKPQVRASLLGEDAKVIDRNLELLSQLKGGYKDIPESQLRAFLGRPNNTVHDLSKIVSAVKRERELFSNETLQKFLKGQTEAGSLPPEKIVDWLLNSNNSSEVAEVMAKLSSNPQLVEQLQRKALIGFLQKARAPVKSSEGSFLDDPSEILSPSKLIPYLKNETKSKILRNVVGDEAFNFIRNYTEALPVIGKHGDSQTGGFAATSAMFNMLRNLPTTAKHVVFATAITNRDLRRTIMEQSLKAPLNTAEFTRYILASTPVVEALGEEFGTTGSELILQGAMDALGSIRNEEGLQQRSPVR